MQDRFCLFHRPHNWRIAAGILVNTNTKVNFTVARIDLKQFAEP